MESPMQVPAPAAQVRKPSLTSGHPAALEHPTSAPASKTESGVTVTLERAPSQSMSKQAGGESPADLSAVSNPGAEAGSSIRGRIGSPQPIASQLDLRNPATVNHANSMELSTICREAYDAPTYSVGHDRYSVGHTNFLYKQYADHQVISFSGSKELKDWGHDASISKAPYKDWGPVHTGFSSAYEELKPLQDSILDKRKPIVVAGHSLGGATATIAALDLKQRGYNVVSLTTFGCPRVGGTEFKSAYDKAGIPSHRYVNSYDVVPRIPKSGFEHVGTPYYLGSNGKMLKSQESILKLWPWEMPKQRVSSHHLVNYETNLAKIMASEA
jgi:hypothetical protein